MKTKVTNLINSILGILLGLLGFTNCGSSDLPCEYGTPNADYIVDGIVTDESGKPIEGVKTIIKNCYSTYAHDEDDSYNNYTRYTDEEGNFHTSINDFPGVNHFDIWYEAEGYLKDSTMNIKPVKTKEGSGSWNQGEYTVSDEKVLKKSN